MPDSFFIQVERGSKSQQVVAPTAQTTPTGPQKTKKTIFAVQKSKVKDGTGTKRRVWKSPRGTYPAFLDGKSTVKGITHELLLQSENRTDAQRSSAAKYTMDTILGTKMSGVLSNENKAKLLAFIIKTNPSVFDQETGRLKDNADVTRLDIPTKEQIAKLCGVQYSKDGKAIVQKDQNGAVMNNFGYSARKDAQGTYHYYAPNGREIKPEEFKQKSPSLYAQLNP